MQTLTLSNFFLAPKRNNMMMVLVMTCIETSQQIFCLTLLSVNYLNLSTGLGYLENSQHDHIFRTNSDHLDYYVVWQKNNCSLPTVAHSTFQIFTGFQTLEVFSVAVVAIKLLQNPLQKSHLKL